LRWLFHGPPGGRKAHPSHRGASIPRLQAEIDFIKINTFSSDQVLNDAHDLQSHWPQMDREEKRKIVECITNKIVIAKDEISLDLIYLPSSKELSKRDWSLARSFPFCHLRFKVAKKTVAKRRVLL